MNTSKIDHVLILGASHAGTEAAFSLRKSGFEGKISLVGDESGLPYQRPPLSKAYLSGDMPAEKLIIKKADAFEKNDIELRESMRANKIDRKNKSVAFDNGEEIDYDKLIIATGTRPRKLQFDSIDDKDVFYIRTKADSDSINIAQRTGQKILFLGGGYIGLEAAASATKMGLNVTLVEAQDRLLKRVTSEPVSEFYLKLHKDAGVDVLIETMIDQYEKTDSGYRATTPNGKHIEFDCLVVGIGVIPNQELAEQCGIECDNGIVVNEFTETNDPDIYAIGDCCNHPSDRYGRRIRLESIPNAHGQAKTAALAITGQKQPYNDLPWFWSDQYDVKLQTVGLFNDFDNIEVEGEPMDKKFAVKYFKDGKLIAVDAINFPVAFMKGKKEITNN